MLSHLKSKKRKVDISDFIPKHCFEQSYCLQYAKNDLVDLKNMACGRAVVCVWTEDAEAIETLSGGLAGIESV